MCQVFGWPKYNVCYIEPRKGLVVYPQPNKLEERRAVGLVSQLMTKGLLVDCSLFSGELKMKKIKINEMRKYC